MKTALTIAGSDSGGGAGIQADLKTFAAHDVYGLSTVTAVTAQNTIGITTIHPVPADTVKAQINAVVSDIGINATKTGMLANAAIVEAVADCVRNRDVPKLVIDPVLVATNGKHLLDEDGIVKLITELIPQALVITPNSLEAEILTGQSVSSTLEAREAARRLHDLGAQSAVVTGGHLPNSQVVDILFDGQSYYELAGPRLISRNTHGTGCAFSAAIAAMLAKGQSLVDAVHSAKRYVEKAIRYGIPIGRGSGPVNHFWRE